MSACSFINKVYFFVNDYIFLKQPNYTVFLPLFQFLRRQKAAFFRMKCAPDPLTKKYTFLHDTYQLSAEGVCSLLDR